MSRALISRSRRFLARLVLRISAAGLIAGLVVAMMAIAITAMAIAWYSARADVMDSLDRRLQRRTQFVQDRYERIVVALDRALVAATQNAEIASLDPARCRTLRGSLGPAVAYALTVATFDAVGRPVCHEASEPPSLETLALSIGAIEAAGRLVIGPPRRVGAPGAPTAGVAVAIREGGKLRGAVVLSLDLVVLSQLIAGVLADDGSEVIVFDRSTLVVAASALDRLTTVLPAAFVAAVERPGVQRRGTGRIDDVQLVHREAQIAGTDWTVVSILPESVFLETVFSRVMPLIASSVLGLIAVVAAAAVLFLALLRPLRRTVDRLAAIDPAAPTSFIRARGLAELRHIARTTNRALAAVRARDREIERGRKLDRELRTAVAGFSEALMLWDSEDRLIYANDAARRMFPDSAAELEPGTPFETLLRARVREGRIAAAIGREEAFIARRLEERRRRMPLTFERQLVDGRWIHSSEDATGDGGLFIIHRDVTAEKRAVLALAEAHRRTTSVLEALAEGVIVRDSRGIVVDANGAACRILGLPREQIVGREFANGVPWRPVDRDGKPLSDRDTLPMRTLAGEGEFRDVVVGMHRPNGERRWISVNTSLVRTEDGRLEFVISSFTDVTTERDATASTIEKSRVIAAASHDLRQPLHAQGLLIRALERRISDPEAAAILASLKGATATMPSMLGALLDLSRLDAGVVVPDIRPAPLSPILRKLADEFAIQARNAGLDLRVVDTSLWVSTDVTLLETMLRNLVGNALRYTSIGSVLLGCRRVGGRVAIWVVDTGPGIAPADQDRIFREFERGSARGENGEPGMGLGLAIVTRLAGIVGATIGLRSEPGRGSGFSVTVPVAEAGVGFVEHVDPGPQHRAMKLAILDDDSLIRDAIGRDLVDQGHTIRSFATASELLAADVEAFDGFIVDLDLGEDRNGLAVVSTLRQRCPATARYVIVTGDMTPASLEMLERAGVPFLIKPASGAAILRVLQAADHG